MESPLLFAERPLPAGSKFSTIRDSLRALYQSDPRPWLIGFSGGKDSTLVAALIFETVLALPPAQRTKEISIVCTDTRVEIPAIAETIEDALEKMRQCSAAHDLKIDVNLLKPPAEQSFWVNIIGRGYPPPNRLFRWCTQRLKIDPVTEFVTERIGRWGEAILHLGARRDESATRAQTLASYEQRNGLRRHRDLPRVWISTPIEHLSTQEVWADLLQRPCPWGGDNRALYKLYAHASGGECPLVVDQSTPSCGNSRFGCWTCTVVERDKASEGLLASGDERMENLLAFRERLLFFRDPANGKRDKRRMNGDEGDGPLLIEARRELLAELLALQTETGLPIISEQELFEIQKFWKSARRPDDGQGVARIVHHHRGTPMNESEETDHLQAIEQTVSREKDISLETLRRLVAKVEEYSEYERTRGLPGDLERILRDELSKANAGDGSEKS